MKKERDIREEITLIRTSLMREIPFYAYLLFHVKIVVSDKYKGYAGVTKNGILVIGKERWNTLTNHDKKFLLLHEISHIALLHWLRHEKHNMKWNIVEDAIINYNLKKDKFDYDTLQPVLLEDLHSKYLVGKYKFDDIVKMSSDELYRLLPDDVNIPDFPTDIGLDDSDIEDGEEIQEGNNDLYDKTKNRGEKERLWKNKIQDALISQRLAGLGKTTSIENEILKLFKPKVDWKTLLKNYLLTSYKGNIVNDWRRESRKHSLLPYYKSLDIPNLYTLVDTSGSISREELSIALSDSYHISKQFNSRMKMILWDDGISEIRDIKRPSDIEFKRKYSGGTRIREVLEYVLRDSKPQDIVIIFSDFDIFDDYLDLARRLDTRNRVIAVTYYNNTPFKKTIKIK